MKKLLLAAVTLLPAVALAHEGDHSMLNMTAGFWHPLNGLDHLLALLATGAWLTQTNTPRKWLLVAAFISALSIAMPIGMLFPSITFEYGIVATLVVLGALMAAAVRGPLLLRAIVLIVVAMVHGFVHGTELPAGEGVAPFCLGLASSSLMVVGFAAIAVAYTRHTAGGLIARLIGVATLIAGLVFSL